MQMYQTLELQIMEPQVATVILNRPEKSNAIDERMVDELTSIFEHLGTGDEVRLIVLRAHGNNFCGGADINFMLAQADDSYEDVHKTSNRLFNLFNTINKTRQPVLTYVQGAVYGGGIGLLAVSDYVLAQEKSHFCFSELRLGLLPATVAPFVIDKIGYSSSRALMLSTGDFTARRALEIGLVHEVLRGELRLEEVIQDFLRTAPRASVACKEMLRKFKDGCSDPRHYAASLITRARLSNEGLEGMEALLEKREASWVLHGKSEES